jgi:hypothetical protein
MSLEKEGKKSEPLTWEGPENEALQALKCLFSQSSALRFPRLHQSFHLFVTKQWSITQGCLNQLLEPTLTIEGYFPKHKDGPISFVQ